MDAGLALVTGVDIAIRVMREPQQEAPINSRDFVHRFATEIKTIELTCLSSRIGATVRAPGDGLRMIEGEPHIGKSQRFGPAGHGVLLYRDVGMCRWGRRAGMEA